MDEKDNERLDEPTISTEAPAQEEMLQNEQVEPYALNVVRDWTSDIKSLGSRLSALESDMASVKKGILDFRTTTTDEQVDDGSGEEKRITDLFVYED